MELFVGEDNPRTAARDLFTARLVSKAVSAVAIAGTVAIGASFTGIGRKMLPSMLRTEGLGQTSLGLLTGAALLASGPLRRVVESAETLHLAALKNSDQLGAPRNVAELQKALDAKAAGGKLSVAG